MLQLDPLGDFTDWHLFCVDQKRVAVGKLAALRLCGVEFVQQSAPSLALLRLESSQIAGEGRLVFGEAQRHRHQSKGGERLEVHHEADHAT